MGSFIVVAVVSSVLVFIVVFFVIQYIISCHSSRRKIREPDNQDDL